MDDNEKRPHSRELRKGRYSASGLTYFITSNVLARRPLLTPPARDIVIDALKWARANSRLWLMGYVVMDDHFHTLLTLRAPQGLGWVMDSLKRHTARQINLLSGQTGTLWQEGYHEHGIRDEADFWQHVEYMHNNPIRRG